MISAMHKVIFSVPGFGDIYDGTALAAHHDVVVVTINYRLGIFGRLTTTKTAGSNLTDKERVLWCLFD